MSGRDLSGWADAWLGSSGIDRLRAEVTAAPDGMVASCAIVRDAEPGEPERSHRIGVGVCDLLPTGLRRRATIMVDVCGARTELPELVGTRLPDLVVVNDGDLTYAETVFDRRSLRVLAAHAAELDDPLTRALCDTAVRS